MLLDVEWWRIHWVGCRSNYESHWSNKATKEFKMLFIGIVYKATWKAMNKKAFIQLLCLQHFSTWRWYHHFGSAIRRRIRFFTCCCNTSWTKVSTLTFTENRSLISSMTDILQNVSQPFSKGDWQTLKLIYFTSIFLNLSHNQIARLKFHLKVVLNCIGGPKVDIITKGSLCPDSSWALESSALQSSFDSR